jgi:hypothetical protein
LITCYFNNNTGCFHFKCDKDQHYFDYINSLLKENYCEFDFRLKERYTLDPFKVKYLLSELKAIDKVFISEEDSNLLEDLLYPKDESFKKMKYFENKEWLSTHKNIIGKKPFENFQLDTIKFSSSRNRFILNLHPGSGKTYCISGTLANYFFNKRIKKILYFCKPEGKESTYIKLLTFLKEYITENDIVTIDNDNRNIEDFFDKKIIIVTYNTFRLIGNYYQKLKTKRESRKPTKKTIDFSKWGKPDELLMLLDEGQAINNYDSLQSHFIHLYKDDFSYRGILSGSLHYKFLFNYSLTKFLVPNTMDTTFSIWKNYMVKERKSYKVELIPERVKEFKEKVLNNLQISFGKEALDTPLSYDKLVYIKMPLYMRELYQTFINKKLEEYRVENHNQELTERNLFNKFPYLIQFTSDPTLVKDEFNFTWDIKDSPKIEIVESLLEKYIEEEHRKIIIWSVHPKIINMLKVLFSKYKPYVIHGDKKTSVKKEDRFPTVQEFRNSKDRNLLLCSYVLQSSIDIFEATRQIYWDLPLDNDVLTQSKHRIDRIGQKEEVENIYLLYNDSIDIYTWFNILVPKEKVKKLLSSNEEMTLDVYKNIFNAKAQSYLTK